jgi:hypothetical protein
MAQISQLEGPAAESKDKDASLARKLRPVVSAALAIPNGGLEAWLQVVGTFFIYFNTWGKSAPAKKSALYQSSSFKLLLNSG